VKGLAKYKLSEIISLQNNLKDET